MAIKDKPKEKAQIIENISVAYSDCAAQRQSDDYQHEDRCLSFCTSEWIEDMETLETALKVIGPYNAFSPERIYDAFRMLEKSNIKNRVAVAREGSPCLYVETDEPHTVIDCFEDFAEVPEPDEMRSLADSEEFTQAQRQPEDRNDDIHHRGCQHEDPVVRDEDQVSRNVEEYPHVVRLWWD